MVRVVSSEMEVEWDGKCYEARSGGAARIDVGIGKDKSGGKEGLIYPQNPSLQVYTASIHPFLSYWSFHPFMTDETVSPRRHRIPFLVVLASRSFSSQSPFDPSYAAVLAR